jgi:hypothetical protein
VSRPAPHGRAWWPEPGRRRRETWFRRRYAELNDGREPDLRRPRLFSERVGARILYERDPQLRIYCDKLRCKTWIDAKLGKEFTPRTLAVVDDARHLAERDLPASWILKASHGSGWWQRISPADQPLTENLIAIANGWLERDYADVNHEWAYAGLPRQLIVEEQLSHRGGSCQELSVFCFASQTPLIRLHRLSEEDEEPPHDWPRECFVDARGRLLPIERPRRHHDPNLREVWAERLEEFLVLARTLTGQQAFLRVDGYLSDSGLKVGELTPYPYAGLGFALEPCWDAWLGSFWI